MTRSQRIAIWVLTLIGLLAAWKLFGQGFGSFSKDQPFLARNYPVATGDSPPLNMVYWWHGASIVGNTATNWLDQSNVVAFISAGANAPAANGTNLSFDGSDTMTNTVIDFSTTKSTVCFVLDMSVTTGDNPILVATNLSFAGLYIRSGTGYYYDGTWNVIIPTASSALTDIIIVFNGNYTTQRIYTNGVLATEVTMYPLPNNTGYNLGYCQNFNWTSAAFDLYDIIYYTNAFDTASVSNFHRWRTNTYGL